MLRRIITCVAALTMLSGLAVAADDAPPWLRQASALGLPPYDKEVKAVVLHDESRMTVDEGGRVTEVTQYAVKILSREGRGEAVARTLYNTASEKVKDMRAWLIRPSGQVVKYGKDQTLDAILEDNDVYNEVRKRTISGVDDVEPGAVFGFEVVSERQTIFSQFNWFFQSDRPVVASRLILTLPAGWRAESQTFNRAKVEPQVSGSTYTWELRDLPPVEGEPAGPSVMNLAARVAVGVFPPAGKASLMRSFSSWQDVSRFLSELADPQMELNDALAAKARELTANAKTEFEKIQALGRFAQGINYISIQIGTGRGGGYRPHSAVEVFNKSYGDCKDKANLMRAMLRAVNIPAYLVTIYSGDPTYVREEWPSPQQFNHCIIGVKVSDATEAHTVVKHPSLGRLLIFDPTDDDTPVGDLPDHEQGSLALIVAGADGALLRMPTTPPEMNRLERTAEVTLTAEGAITAKVTELAAGQPAVTFRRQHKRLAKPDYVKMIERWVTRGATGAQVGKVEAKDSGGEGRFALDVEFSVPAYAQSMRGRLLVFKPAIVSRREHPVLLDSQAYTETVKIKLPAGFDVDEVPDAEKLDAPFGRYSTSYEVKDGHLVFKREFEVRAVTVPAEHYQGVRAFFDRIRAAEQAPVVLVRK
jgi:hypothetical protein